jgi:translation initiation factor 2 gamma subunit (eIF-2gamma)
MVAFGKNQTHSRHVSFVDCPGHDILMATMLTGAAVSEYRVWPCRVLRTSARNKKNLQR